MKSLLKGRVRMLDIIIPHYDEPWEDGKRYFDMLGCQRGVDFGKIRVLLIHDGTRPFPDRYFEDYPYKVEQHTIRHKGVSAARNKGLDLAKAKWVTFCDFDDTYANVFSLKFVMDLLPTDECDLLWGSFIMEGNHFEGADGKLFLTMHDEFNMVWVHNKYYRLDFLRKHKLRFNEELWYSEDSAFNAILEEHIDRDRICTIKAPLPGYVWCFRKDSTTTNPKNVASNVLGHFRRNQYVTDTFTKDKQSYANVMAARTMTDAYVDLNRKDLPPMPKDGEKPDKDQKLVQQLEDEVYDFFVKYRKDMKEVSEKNWNRVMQATIKEGKMCRYIKEDRPTFAQWLKALRKKHEKG